MDLAIRPMTPDDEPHVEALLDAVFAGRIQVRIGEAVDVLTLPGFVARHEGRVVGAAMYRVDGDAAELAALLVDDGSKHVGAGTALVAAVVDAARGQGAGRLWLVTMNDNVDALRFYQRRGFHLSELRLGAADIARQLKPSMPLTGLYGIPIRDELVLERVLY